MECQLAARWPARNAAALTVLEHTLHPGKIWQLLQMDDTEALLHELFSETESDDDAEPEAEPVHVETGVPGLVLIKGWMSKTEQAGSQKNPAVRRSVPQPSSP